MLRFLDQTQLDTNSCPVGLFGKGDQPVAENATYTTYNKYKGRTWCQDYTNQINPLNPELNPICYLLALLAHHFLNVSRITVKSLILRLLMSYIYIYIYI